MAAGIDGGLESPQTALVHGTALVIGDRGVILRGPPGSGKSDLALRALCGTSNVLMPWAVRLIADDQVSVTRGIGGVTIAAPPTIAGKLEVRGLGIVDLAPAAVATGSSRLVLVVDLTDSRDLIERMPEWAVTDILGTKVACLKLYPFDGTAAVKLVLAVLAAPATL